MNLIGNITQLNAEPSGTNSNIYLMDVRNFTWVNSFEFEIEQHGDKNENSQSNDKKVIVAAVVGVIVTIIVMIGAFLIYKWVKKHRKRNLKPPNPGDDGRPNAIQYYHGSES